MHGPTHQFCTKCSAMLPTYLDECPRCGQNLRSSLETVRKRDILQITGVVLLMAIVPLLVIILTTVTCLALSR